MLKLSLLAAALAALPGAAMAQAYPSKPIRLVIPFGPGSATDMIGRYVTDRAGKILGVSFIVDNRPGANGMIAARELLKSPTDGYTIMMSSNSAHAANVYLYKDLNYDPVKDFAPITGMTLNPHVMVIRSGIPAQNLKELIAHGKANPGKLNFGSGNTGGLANASLFMSTAGFTAQEVTYKSPPAAVIDLLGGRIDFMSVDYFIVADHFKAGTLRPLGVTSKTRLKALPDVPPIADTLPGYELNGWTASFAAAGTPPDVIARLNKAFTSVLATPEVDDYFERQGMQTFATTPEALGAFVKEQVGKWAEVLSKAGVARQ
jgi:tripartite-type tricarboxylate transporter receptor subunit TctC